MDRPSVHRLYPREWANWHINRGRWPLNNPGRDILPERRKYMRMISYRRVL